MSSENEGVSRVASIDIYWTSVEALGSFLYVFCVVSLYLLFNINPFRSVLSRKAGAAVQTSEGLQIGLQRFTFLISF
jgi:hypothetical protein